MSSITIHKNGMVLRMTPRIRYCGDSDGVMRPGVVGIVVERGELAGGQLALYHQRDLTDTRKDEVHADEFDRDLFRAGAWDIDALARWMRSFR